MRTSVLCLKEPPVSTQAGCLGLMMSTLKLWWYGMHTTLKPKVDNARKSLSNGKSPCNVVLGSRILIGQWRAALGSAGMGRGGVPCHPGRGPLFLVITSFDLIEFQ